MAVKGTWFGGLLPDLGWTERFKIGSGYNWQNPQIVKQAQAQAPVQQTSSPQQSGYQPTGQTGIGPGSTPILWDPTVYNLNAGNQNRGTSISTNQPIPTNNVSQGYQNIQQAQASGNSQIDADYEQSMAMLGSAEQGLRGQAETATGTITGEAAATKTALGAEQATKEQSAQTSLSTAEKQGTSAMQQARDLFRTTQNVNNATLSSLGLMSSSVAEALQERLGIEVAKRIFGVAGSLQEVRQNTVNELGRIKNYYQEKATQVQDWVANEKSKIQNTLLSGLNQINQARGQAANAKSQARANLLSQVQEQVYALTQQQQQFQQSLQLWKEQKSAALTPIVQDPTYFNSLQTTQNTLNEKFAPTGFGYTPSFNKDTQLSGWTTQKLPKLDANGNPIDENTITNPFRKTL